VFDIVGHIDQAGYALKIGDIAFGCSDVARYRL